MSTTDFTPDRSAAIRQLLLDTVADEPRRRRRLQILLTSVLSGVAVALAGGTAALALTGAIHLGSGDTPPPAAPAPTPPGTPPPTPARTLTPKPAPPPLVQSAPVLPHDVDSLRPTTRWSLDLPGDPICTSANAYTLSDARVVYVSGLRPKEYEGSDCIDHVGEDFGVTLVDTSDGTVLWQREWKFTPKNIAFGVGFEVLGTSGRAVFASAEAGVGPHDVLDLTTGETVGTFEPGWSGFTPARDMRAVPDGSGDVLTIQHFLDAQGRTAADDILTRSDPADFAHPKWSRPVGMGGSELGFIVPGGAAMNLDGWTQSGIHRTTMIELQTGQSSLVPGNVNVYRPMSRILLGSTQSPPNGQTELVAYGSGGQKLWSRTASQAAQVFPAASPGTVPGLVNGYQTSDTGELFVKDAQTLTLIDQATGAERWAIPIPACFTRMSTLVPAMLDARRDVFLLGSAETSCAVSHESGAVVDGPSIPVDGPFFQVFGLTHRYDYDSPAASGAAHDLATGELLWTRERHDFESWRFDGGYLVAGWSNHIESIG